MELRHKVMSAEDAAALIPAGADGQRGFLGPLDFAVVEAVGVTSDGDLIPSTSVGNNKTWIEQADQVIVEVNAGQSMQNITYMTADE